MEKSEKLTDAEIVKALKKTKYKVNGVVTQGFYLSEETYHSVIEFIDRLQKSNERLKTEVKLLSENSITAKYPHCVLTGNGAIFTKSLEEYNRLLENISNNAIKEFLQKAEDVFKQKGGNND